LVIFDCTEEVGGVENFKHDFNGILVEEEPGTVALLNGVAFG
jgi:hypothetical protein